MQLLRVVALEVLEGCNLTCSFCVRNATYNLSNKITLENYLVLLDMLEDFPERPRIAITGGEPFLYRALPTLLETAFKRGFSLSITSNGTVRNEKVLSLCKDNISSIQFVISLDSYDAEVHNTIRGLNAYERTISFIERLRQDGIRFGINMTVGEMNLDDVDETIKLAHSLGARDISVATIKPNGRGEATLDLKKLTHIAEQIINNKPLINDFFKVIGSEVTLFLYDMDTYAAAISNGASGSCSFGGRTLHIRANGDVLGCTACEGVPLGNIFEDHEVSYLRNVWEQNDILAKIRSKKYLGGACKDCKFQEFCGGCRCRAYGVYGDLYAEDPYCPIVLKKGHGK